MDFITSLPPLLQTFWYLALPITLFFCIQTILTFAGADFSDGLDVDFDGDLDGESGPFQLFSLRNLINFLLGFSWSGICLYDRFVNTDILIVVSFFIGLAFVSVFFVVIRQVKKLAEDNTFKIQDTLCQTAEVYMKIPENKTGKGKVHLNINGSLRELDAISLTEGFKVGMLVKVKTIQHPDILVVEAL